MTAPHLDLLVRCTFHPLGPEDLAALRALAAATTAWAEFGELATLNKVEPKVVLALTRADALKLVPPSVRAGLQAVATKVAETNRLRLEQARSFFPVLVEHGIPVCVLKGALFGETLYGEPGYKRMNDVDFLVPRADINRLPALLEANGFFSIAERVGHRRDVQTKVSHHLPPYVSRDLTCVLGAQWGLKSPLLGLDIDLDAMWARARPFDFRGVPLQQLSPTDNLFHVCVHLGFFKAGLRDVMDIFNLAHAGDVDWALFSRLVEQSGAFDLVFHSLSLAHTLRPHPQMAVVLARLTPRASAFMRRAVLEKTRELAVLLRLCSGYLSVIEKAIADFNDSEAAPEKLRSYAHFWSLVLRPPEAEARRICFQPDPSPLQRRLIPFRAPARVLRAIGAEIGAPLLGVLLAKGTFDAMATAVTPSAWRASRSRGLEAFAQRHGLATADVQRLHDSIF